MKLMSKNKDEKPKTPEWFKTMIHSKNGSRGTLMEMTSEQCKISLEMNKKWK